MDCITKATVFGGKALVSLVDITDISNYAIERHGLNDGSAEALSRVLAYTAFITAGMKGIALKASVTIDADGKFGRIIAAGSTGGIVRGAIDVKEVGAEEKLYLGRGTMTVVKDFGLKEPYSGKIELVRGDIDSDFAYYFRVSEQLNTVCLSKADVVDGICKRAGAIIVQPMPNCDDESLFLLEDTVNNIKDVTGILNKGDAEAVIDYYFGHFSAKIIDRIYPKYVCSCSKERIISIIRSLGREEAESIIEEQGAVEAHCDFCNTTYRFEKQDIDELFH